MRGTTQVPSAYVILRRNGQIAFVLREHTNFMDGFYSLPAGHVEDMETYKQAAVREAKEESGVDINEDDLYFVQTVQRKNNDHVRIDVYFEAKAWQGEPYNAEPERHSQLVWFDENDLPTDKIMDYQAAALRQIATGERYSQFGW
jgi:8-oxo-dGTP diphosphatase